MTKRETKFAMLTAAVAVAAMLSGGGVAEAASLTVTGGTTIAIPGNNDFKVQLTAAGATGLTWGGLLGVDGPGTVTYTYMAAESGYINTFNVYTQGSYDIVALQFSKTEGNEAWAANVLIGSQEVAAGALSLEFTSNNGVPAQNGGNSFGIYQTSNPNLVFLGYDDNGAGPDGDYDDMIIKVEFAPVPVPGE